MEVHHNSHPERKKSWKSYFWEFLMLFLAVFCGFLAEYQLEHKIEKERGMQYIYSFYEDLKTDTAYFTMLISEYEVKLIAFKKRKECYDSIPYQLKSSSPCLADLVDNASGFPDLVVSDRTLLQLKNAGGLRLLPLADADSILVYDRMVRNYTKTETTGFQENQTRLREVIYSLQNYKNMKLDADDPRVPYLFSENKEILNKFFVILESYSYNCYTYTEKIKMMKQQATRLIEFFKDKYQLN